MKTFRDFILECELVEGKVEWDNPKKPLQSGLTPREKNRAVRKRLGIETLDTDKPSFFKGGPGEKEYERYGKLKAAHDAEKDKKVSPEERHKFKSVAKGRLGRKYSAGEIRRMAGVHSGAHSGRNAETGKGSYAVMSQTQGGKERREKDKKRYGDYADLKRLKEPKESFDYNIDEGRIPWDDKNRPLRSGWTPREKNRAKRISTGVENPEHSPTEKQLERYGKLQSAHDTQKNVKVKPKDRHKNPEDYSLGRRNAFFKSNPTLPSEHQKGDSSGLRKMPRNVSKGEDVFTRKYGSKNDEKRDKFYKKGPKGLKEPKESFDYNINEGIQPLPTQKMLRKIKQKSKATQDAMEFRRENQSSHTGDSLERLKALTKRKIEGKASQIKKMKTAMRTHDPVVGQFKELENRVKGRK